MNHNVLVVDDDESMVRMLAQGLSSAGFTVTTAPSAPAALAALHQEEFAVVLTDVRMPGQDGLTLCREVMSQRSDVPVVVMTAFGSLDSAVAAIRAGAYDFVTKPFELDAIRLTLKRAAEHRALANRVRYLEHALHSAEGLSKIIGECDAMKELFDLVGRVALTEVAALVQGESGTGKELVARAIHDLSPRKDGPFVAVNCAAMPETLLESELFGHSKGAFTDARNAHTGLFLQASGGTLFLDEVGELPLGLQPKLLRALQEKTIRPLGATKEVTFDARIVTATNRDLEASVEAGRFRADLYYRIQVVPIDVPPLRYRGNDILLLSYHFAQSFAEANRKAFTRLHPAAAEQLMAYPWPGNVRELRNCIERACTLGRTSEITLDDLPEKIRSYQRTQTLLSSDELSEMVTMEEVERRYILKVIDAAQNNKSVAAKILGFNRKTLYRKLRQYGVEPSDQAD